MKAKIPISIFINILIIIAILVFSMIWGNSNSVVKNSYFYVTVLSAFTLIISLVQLRKIDVNVLSFSGIFLILLHVFTLGYYYLKSFGKEEFYIYSDWFSTDIEIKGQIGLFAVCAIEALFTGMYLRLYGEKTRERRDYRFAEMVDFERKRRIVYTAGLVLFLITLPCRLYIDYTNIITTRINGEYAGFSGIVGIVDDMQTLFIPSLICLLYGKRENKKICRAVIVIYIISCVFVMALSGSRRYYITAIIAIILFYINTDSQKKISMKPLKVIVIIAAGIVTLNFMTMIRNYRHTALGLSYLLGEHRADLFSLDFIWESLSEFGITGNALYYAAKYFPSQIKFQFGYTYLASIIYILPIGWLIDLNASVGNIIQQISRASVGGSLMADLYANWGWWSIIPSFLLGYIISTLCYADKNTDNTQIRSVVSFAASYTVLNYARASSSEIFRYTAYLVLAIYLLCRVMLSRKRMNLKR